MAVKAVEDSKEGCGLRVCRVAGQLRAWFGIQAKLAALPVELRQSWSLPASGGKRELLAPGRLHWLGRIKVVAVPLSSVKPHGVCAPTTTVVPGPYLRTPPCSFKLELPTSNAHRAFTISNHLVSPLNRRGTTCDRELIPFATLGSLSCSEAPLFLPPVSQPSGPKGTDMARGETRVSIRLPGHARLTTLPPSKQRKSSQIQASPPEISDFN
jgi:hypothetical protein